MPKKPLSVMAKQLTLVPVGKLPNTKAWKYTSLLVRLRAKGRCYTCEGRFPIEDLNAGHFREKIGSAGIYFELDGLRGQCYRCNRELHGNYAVYHPKLIKEIGMERYDNLNRKTLRTKIWTLWELEQIAEERKKLVEIEKAKQENEQIPWQPIRNP